MKAMLTNSDRRLVWSDVPDPVFGRYEVLVKIRAAALNRADLLQREGKYPSPPGCPPWMGLEIAGEVVAVGAGVEKWKPGDKVCALLGGGGYAEYAAVRQDMLMPIPRGLSAIEAAALPEAFATSYLNLFIEGHLRAGQTAYIPAGASGLASAAIPLAKAFGTRVITSVRQDGVAEKIAALGADRIINTAREDAAECLRAEAEAGHPVNVAMDCLTGKDLGLCLPYMAKGGYWVVISTLAGTETVLPLRPLLTKGIHITGSMLRNRDPRYKAKLLSRLVRDVWPKLESGAIRPLIYKTLPMTEAEAAHDILLNNQNVGKVVLTVE